MTTLPLRPLPLWGALLAACLFGPAPALTAAPCSGQDGDGDGYACQNDCNDAAFEIHPGAQEVGGNGVDENCNGLIDEADGDGDGRVRPEDCQDANPAIRPGAPEVVNAIDDDCDGAIDEDTRAEDRDGDGAATSGGDCDDGDAGVGPGMAEEADGRDEDCDGKIDEGTWASDDDRDGYCEGPTCVEMAVPGDCVDTNPAIRPGAAEVENGIDDDCDGVVDGGGPPEDGDGDGFLATAGDCDDGDPARSPGATEAPNGVDDDCDGRVDEGTQATDDDGDGLSEEEGDCDDSDGDVAPGVRETADGRDSDCDGKIDEGTRAFDDDGDGLTEEAGDCDDTNPQISPAADELPGTGKDENCDGLVDELTAFDEELDTDGDGVEAGDGDCDDLDDAIYPGAPEACDGVDTDCDGQADPDTCGAGGGGGGCDQAGGGASGLPWLLMALGLGALLGRGRRWAALGALALLPVMAGCTGSTDVSVAQSQGTLTLSPEGGLLDLGPIFVGETIVGEAFLLNSGGSPLTITSVRVEGETGLPFTVEPFSGTLELHDEVTIRVTYAPKSAGSHLARLVVAHGAGSSGGTAITSMTLRGRAAPLSLTLSPQLLDFGPVAAGDRETRSTRLYNHGLAAATLSEGALEGAGYTWRIPGYAAGPPVRIEPGEALDVEVVAAPGAGAGSLSLAVSGVPLTATLRANACVGSLDPAWDDDGDGVNSCAGDCDDADPHVGPGQTEAEDGDDNDCDGDIDEGTLGYDDDGDCFCEQGPCAGSAGTCAALAGGDCHDGDAAIYPGAPEAGRTEGAVADGIDNDCDGAIDDSFGGDLDGDGFTAAAGDCDEGDPDIRPGAPELPGGEDEDCDGLVDEGTLLFDDDGDGFCEAAACSDGSAPGDCDDADPARNPGVAEAPETPAASDGLDNDCDGRVDEAPYPLDGDGDGYAPEGGDCDDGDPDVNPGETERCDGRDTNCDGVLSPQELDADGDGLMACAGDCDDSDGAIFPGAAERCNGLDDDCNGIADPPGDADGDGIPNGDEGEGDLDGDGLLNCLDPDGDGDFVADSDELAAGSSPTDTDTDDDGFSDLIEIALGTDPTDPESNPDAGDDLAFIMPFGEAASPGSVGLGFNTFIQLMDLYFSFDNTSSMRAELIAMQGPEIGIPALMRELTCAERTLCPDGSPGGGTGENCAPESEVTVPCEENIDCAEGDICGLAGVCIENPLTRGCVPDIWSGVASWSEPKSFENLVGLQPSAALTATSVPQVGGGTYESPPHAVACAANGIHCQNPDINCEVDGVGCPGFRPDALKVYVQITDANDQCGGSSGSQATLCNTYTATHAGELLGETGIRFLCLFGGGDPDNSADWSYGSPESVCREIGIASGTVDAEGEPYVVEAVDAQVAPLTVASVRKLISTYPLDVTLTVEDLPGDDGDSLAFIERLQTNITRAGCEAPGAQGVIDDDGDGYGDSFEGVLPGTPVCWDLIAKETQTVAEAIGTPLVFHALLRVYGGGGLLNRKDVFFIVPPVISAPSF